PLAALVLLVRGARRLSALDVWLIVTMLAWLCTIALGAFISRGRYDIGWYVGSFFDFLTSIFVLLILISQIILLYERQASAAAASQRLRERRINEMEAVLIHLSRVSELGQDVSSRIQVVNQPLTEIPDDLRAPTQVLR